MFNVGEGFDQVLDFEVVKDRLDLRPALPGYGLGDYMADFVRVQSDAGSTIVSIDPTGGSGSFTDVLRLVGTDVTSLASSMTA